MILYNLVYPFLELISIFVRLIDNSSINIFNFFGWFISTIIAVVGLYFVYAQLKENNKTRQLELFYNHLGEIKKMELEEFKLENSNIKYNKEEWNRLFLNSVEELCFIFNSKYINDTQMQFYIKDAVIYWYEHNLKKNKDYLNKSNFYCELKRLYSVVKKKN
jgi:hypothetical protein